MALERTNKERLEDLKAHANHMEEAAEGLAHLVGWVTVLEEG